MFPNAAFNSVRKGILAKLRTDEQALGMPFAHKNLQNFDTVYPITRFHT